MVKKTKKEEKTRKKLNYILYTLGTYILIYIIYKEREEKRWRKKKKHEEKITHFWFKLISPQKTKQVIDALNLLFQLFSVILVPFLSTRECARH